MESDMLEVIKDIVVKQVGVNIRNKVEGRCEYTNLTYEDYLSTEIEEELQAFTGTYTFYKEPSFRITKQYLFYETSKVYKTYNSLLSNEDKDYIKNSVVETYYGKKRADIVNMANNWTKLTTS